MHRIRARTRALSAILALVAVHAVAGPVEDLEPGHWYEAPNSKLDSVRAAPGATAVINAWNGGAYDTVNDRLIVWGGGHGDYSGNEIYVFDVATLTWTRWTEPSGNTSCNFSVNEYPDGAPCAMHTYDYVDFDPNSESFVLLGGASPYPQGGGGAPTAHLYSFETNAWRRGADRTGGSTLEGATSAWDPNREVFWVLPAYDQKFAKFDPSANGGAGAWTQYSNVSIEIDAASAIDPVHDLFVTVDGRGTHRVRVHDLANPAAAPVTVTTNGDRDPEQVSQIGFDWDPVVGKFVAWFGGTSVWTLTPPSSNWMTSAWVWHEEQDAPSNTVTPTAENANGTYSRWRYVPSRNVFIVVNRTSDNVFFYKLSEGGGATSVHLDADPATVVSGGSTTLSWSSTGATSCTASGSWSGSKGTSGSQVMSNLLSNRNYVLTCTGEGGTAQDSASVTVTPPAPTVMLTAAPTTVGVGGSSTLTWSSTNATQCTASGDWSNTKPISGSQVMVGLTSDRHYVLTCTGPGGSANDDASVTVESAPPTVTLTAAPTSVAYDGSSTLTWSSANATSCTASGDWSGAKATSGSQVMSNLTANRHYVLTCTGAEGSADDDASVTVAAAPKPTVTLTAAPEGVSHGGSSTLTWASTNATSCVASGDWSGARATTGSEVMNGLTADRHYVLTCTGAGGSANDGADVTVGPAPPAVTLSADPDSVDHGGATTLTWSAPQADLCIASGDWSGARAASGAEPTAGLGADTSFTLSCLGEGGRTTVTTNVAVGAAPNGQPVVVLTATPSAAERLGYTTLVWSAEDATECAAAGAWHGARETSGSESVGPLSTDSVFTLSCTGPGGTTSHSVTVDVPLPAMQPTLSLTVDAQSIPSGSTAILTWSSTHADGCVASGGWSGGRAASGSASTGALTSDAVFELRCTGSGGTVAKSVTVDVVAGALPVPVVSFAATASSIAYGSTTGLTWQVEHASWCAASGAWSGVKPAAGEETTAPLSASSSFRLTCFNGAGRTERIVNVVVAVPADGRPVVALSADDYWVSDGGTATLSWSATNAASCVASGDWSGPRAPTGNEATMPMTRSGVYRLRCTGAAGEAQAQVAIGVDSPENAARLEMSADRGAIDYGDEVELAWVATEVERCVASGGWSGERPVAGSERVTDAIATRAFTLTCTGPSGAVARSVSVDVGVPAAPVLKLNVAEDTLAYGGTAVLDWTSEHADVCVATGDWSGERTPNGIESIGPLTMAAEFVLTCAGAGGSVLASERVDVLEPSGDDTDGDGLPDEWERVYFGGLDRDGGGDPDADGLSNADELDARTDPTLWDSDDDGSGDAEELYYGSDPRDASDVWTAHRPMQPQVADADELALRGGILDTQAVYLDPDGTPLGYAEWQLGTDESFVELVLARTVLGVVTLEIPAGVLERSSTYWARTRHVDTTGLPSIWSEARRVTTASAFPNDADGDDVDDDYQVSGFADANADGVDDAAQGLCNLYDAEGRSIIAFGSSSGRIRCFTSIANRELPGGEAYADQLDYGMFAFAIDGLEVNEASPATVRVTIYLPEAPTPLSSWYKYDEANGEITDYGAYSTISDQHMLLTLIDGGAGDQDGVVNGVIVDPSGPAIAAMPPPPSGGGGDGDGDREPAPGGGKEQDEGGGGGASGPLFLFLLWRAVTRRPARGACAPRVS